MEEGNRKNKLLIMLSCLDESVKIDGKYFIPQKNKKLQREISEDFQENADVSLYKYRTTTRTCV